MTDFTIIKRLNDGNTILDLFGDLETLGITKLKEELENLIRDDRTMILLNLEKIGRFNSTALGILIGRLRRVRVAGGDIKIYNVKPALKKMFDLMGVTRVFDIYGSETEALGSISEKA